MTVYMAPRVRSDCRSADDIRRSMTFRFVRLTLSRSAFMAILFGVHLKSLLAATEYSGTIRSLWSDVKYSCSFHKSNSIVYRRLCRTISRSLNHCVATRYPSISRRRHTSKTRRFQLCFKVRLVVSSNCIDFFQRRSVSTCKRNFSTVLGFNIHLV